jgi:hypothetical protein
MIISEVVTLGIYAFSMVFLPEYFGASDPTLYSALPRRSQHFCHCLFFLFLPPRSIVCRIRAVRVESGGHCCCERVAAVDHQIDQESRRARGHDEAVEIRDIAGARASRVPLLAR